MIGPAARLCLAALLLGLSACSRELLHDAAARPSVEISRAPFFPQSDHHCGPAALATILTASGADTTPGALTSGVYLPGRKGSLQAELLASARHHARVAYVVDPSLQGLLAELEHDRPVLVLQNFGLPYYLPMWHYAVVIGYDREHDTFLLRSGRHPRKQVAATRFLGTWGRAGNWGFIALRPGELPAEGTVSLFLEAVDALDAQGDHSSATASYEAAIERWPAEPVAWLALGNNRSTLGQSSAAEGAYREALRLAPDDLPARNNLALLLARRGCRTEALAMLESARVAAANGPLAAEIADSLREIQALALPAAPQLSCP